MNFSKVTYRIYFFFSELYLSTGVTHDLYEIKVEDTVNRVNNEITESIGTEEENTMTYTYILQCADGSYYTGWTVDLEARINSHNNGTGARYTRSRLPVRLVYWEPQQTRSDAQRREAAIRKLARKQKEKLVMGTSGQP